MYITETWQFFFHFGFDLNWCTVIIFFFGYNIGISMNTFTVIRDKLNLEEIAVTSFTNEPPKPGTLILFLSRHAFVCVLLFPAVSVN